VPLCCNGSIFFNLKTHKISFRFYSRDVLQKPASFIVPMATPRSGVPPPPTLPDASAMALRAMCSPSPHPASRRPPSI
jgi:hypothetical protein